MKKAGDVLSFFFDEKLLKKARGYTALFSSESWARITASCGLAQAAAHSRVATLERKIITVEAEHPGWVQLLQTKQHEILEALRKTLSDEEIRGISLRLGKTPPETEAKPVGAPTVAEAPPAPADTAPPSEPAETGTEVDWDAISDNDLKESLKRLKESIESGFPRG